MTVVAVLYLLNILVPIWLARRSCIRPGGIEINHVLMFTFGYLFYWILPMGIGIFRVAADEPVLRLWFLLFDAISVPNLILYFLVTLGCYLSFWGGSEWVRRRLPEPQRRNPRYRRLFFYKNTLNIPLVIGSVLAATYAFLLRGELFTGYTNPLLTPTESPGRSAFTGVSVSLLSVAIIYAAKLDERVEGEGRFRALLRNHFFVVYFLVAVLVLSLGGRLYFVSSLIMLLVYRTTYFRRIPVRWMVLIGLIGVAFAGVAGVVRQGQSLAAGQGLINLATEPIFVGVSHLHFLQANSFEVIKFPIFLLGYFINLVPTAFLPDKAAYLPDPSVYGYEIFTPLGGVSSFFSFMVNFGVLGTFAALFGVGAGLAYLRGRDRTLLYRVIYVMLTGWLGLTFFRDPFSISVVKSMFEFSIAEPILLVLALQVLSTIIAASRAPAGDSPEGAPGGANIALQGRPE